MGLLAILLVVGIAAWLFFPRQATEEPAVITTEEEAEGGPVNYQVPFEIYTLGTRRDFTASRYHNLDEKVFISPEDTNFVQVRAGGVTWGDFFETLPMELTPECLVTGTGQEFCDGEGGNLRFYVNGVAEGNFLEREIKEGDTALIVFEE